MSELSVERKMMVHVLPLWQPIPSQPLTPFVEQIREMCIEWAKRIRAKREAEIILATLPAQGPRKIGCGIRQIKANELPRIR